jgi:uncharacterized protein (TIGR02145 family)
MKNLLLLSLLLLIVTVLIISCKKDDSSNPNPPSTSNTGTVTDIDGNTYTTITIGTQEWMKENLKTTRYRNGDLIPTNLSNTQWENTTEGAFSVYNDVAQYNNIYGKLYNWYAVADPRELCPTGWHVPSDGEWDILATFLGGNLAAGGKMKTVGELQAGTGFWESPNVEASNISGFSGLPGGSRNYLGVYGSINFDGIWWSSTQSNNSNYQAYSRFLFFYSGELNDFSGNFQDGFSVRCLKD